MRVLGPVAGSQSAVVLRRKADGSKGRRIGPKFVRHDPAWREAMLFEQLLHQLFSGFRITPALGEEVQNLAFIVHGAEAQSEPGIEPDRMADDFGWEAMTLSGELEHRPNLVPAAPHCHLGLCDKAAGRTVPCHTSQVI